LTISLSGYGKDMPVSTVVDGVRELAGVIRASPGTGIIPADRLVGKGKRVDVKVDTRDGQEQVILVSGKDPECEDTERRDDDGCRPVGGFLLDEVATISITKGPTGTVFSGSPTSGVLQITQRKKVKPGRIAVGAQIGITRFHNFEDQVGNQPGITSFSGDESPVTVGAYLASRLGDLPFEVQVGAHYVVQDYTQTFSSGDRFTGTVRGYFLETDVFYVLPVGGRRDGILGNYGSVGLGGGAVWAINRLRGLDPLGTELTRTHHALQGSVEAWYRFPLGGGFQCGAGVGYATGGSGDADARLKATFKLQRHF
jgi:hypothetical protein